MHRTLIGFGFAPESVRARYLRRDDAGDLCAAEAWHHIAEARAAA